MGVYIESELKELMKKVEIQYINVTEFGLTVLKNRMT